MTEHYRHRGAAFDALGGRLLDMPDRTTGFHAATNAFGSPRRLHLWMPIAALLAVLSVLVVLPILRARYLQPIYEDMQTLTEPSRSLVTRIHVALAIEGSILRDFRESADTMLALRYRAVRAEEDSATSALEALVRRLGPVVERDFADLTALQTAWHAGVDSQIATPTGLHRETKLEAKTYEDLLLSAARLDEALNAAADNRWQQ